MSALFEAERDYLEDRISKAEHELVARERDLFSSPDCAQERNAIVAALSALMALRVCNGIPRKAA